MELLSQYEETSSQKLNTAKTFVYFKSKIGRSLEIILATLWE
jgi:hypothetical protein